MALKIACQASVSMQFWSTEQGTRVQEHVKNGASKERRGGLSASVSFLPLPLPPLSFLALVPFLARPKPKIPFLGLSLLRSHTETLDKQAMLKIVESGAELRGKGAHLSLCYPHYLNTLKNIINQSFRNF